MIQTNLALSRENLFSGLVNNKGADQPAHMYSLISVFVFHSFEGIVSRRSTSEIFIFYLVSVAQDIGFSPFEIFRT